MRTAVAALAAAVMLTPAPAQAPQEDAAVTRGRAIYAKVGCYACHGYAGQGGLAGPRLAPDPLPVEAITAYIRAPAGVMPPYSEKVLSDAQVADIRAFLATLPPPPPLESIPQLRDR